jgi:hypothetical protein
MKRTSSLLVAAALVAALGASRPALAGGACAHGDQPYERCQWVMVFTVDGEGHLVLETRGSSGVYVSAGQPPSDLCDRIGCGHVRPSCGYSIVVSSDRPFALPRGFQRRQAFCVAGPAPWRAEHSAKLCRLLGVQHGSVRVQVHRWASTDCAYGPPTPCLQAGWPWFELSDADRVFVDGCFVGRGPLALSSAAPGRHRITVLTVTGRKVSRWVVLPAHARHSACNRGGAACR